jgi:hypothetical protein
LEALDGRRLSRTVRAEDPEDLSRFDLERQVVDGHNVTVGLTKVIHRDHGHNISLDAPTDGR